MTDAPDLLAALQRSINEAQANRAEAERTYAARPGFDFRGRPLAARTFSGTTHDGTPVVVTVHDAEGVADLAFADATGRFGPAVELSEEQA